MGSPRARAQELVRCSPPAVSSTPESRSEPISWSLGMRGSAFGSAYRRQNQCWCQTYEGNSHAEQDRDISTVGMEGRMTSKALAVAQSHARAKAKLSGGETRSPLHARYACPHTLGATQPVAPHVCRQRCCHTAIVKWSWHGGLRRSAGRRSEVTCSRRSMGTPFVSGKKAATNAVMTSTHAAATGNQCSALADCCGQQGGFVLPSSLAGIADLHVFRAPQLQRGSPPLTASRAASNCCTHWWGSECRGKQPHVCLSVWRFPWRGMHKAISSWKSLLLRPGAYLRRT